VAQDVVCRAKALGAGLPLSALGASPRHMASLPAGGHGATFDGGPLACAAALAALDGTAREDLPGRAGRLGAAALRRLGGLAAGTPALVDIRGEGLMLGLEFRDGARWGPSAAFGDAVARALEAEGVLALCSEPDGSVVRLLPPLLPRDAELGFALCALERVLAAAYGARPAEQSPFAARDGRHDPVARVPGAGRGPRGGVAAMPAPRRSPPVRRRGRAAGSGDGTRLATADATPVK
jgi:4-aminobutyrate aminotransferase-like enzyme